MDWLMRKLGRLLYALLNSRVIALLLFALLIGFSWWGFRPQTPPTLAPAPVPVAAPAPPEPVAPPAPEWVTVTTAQGDTVVKAGAAWLLLEPQTTVEIPTAPDRGRWEVRLTQGTLWAFVRKLVSGEEFVVRTPVATAGVRGTRFLVRHRGERTEIAVEEGTVVGDGPGGRLELNAGDGVVVTPAGARRTPTDALLPEWRTGTDRSESAFTVEGVRRELERLTGAGRGPAPAVPGALAGGEANRREPAPRELAGHGTWTSPQGFGGPVFVAVDLPEGTFRGHFSGTGNRGGAAMTLTGTFSGTYRGDRTAGSFAGTVGFDAAGGRRGREVSGLSGQIEGTLRNGTITGGFSGAGLAASFTVTGLGE